jgi:quercetin dioxygenase-like cupin family protein
MHVPLQTVLSWMPPPAARQSGETVTRLQGAEVEVLVVDLAGVPEPSLHTHDVEQIVIVLDGSVRLNVAGAEHELAKGDAVVVPPHVRHGAASVGSETGHLIEVRRVSGITVGR